MVEEAEPKYPETPELNRMRQVIPAANTITQFIEWLESEDIVLCEEVEGEYVSINRNMEQLLADHLNIDLEKVEAERLAVLEYMRKLHEKNAALRAENAALTTETAALITELESLGVKGRG